MPDLRNFGIWSADVKPGDFVFACSDGIHDNLDPQMLGLLPADFGYPDYATWKDVYKIRHTYTRCQQRQLKV